MKSTLSFARFAVLPAAVAVLAATTSAYGAEPSSAASQRAAQKTEPNACNDNPEGEGVSKSAPARIGKADRAFVTKAATANLFEIQAAKLAASRAADPRVKTFAAMLERDHAKAFDGLKAISASHNYPLPDQLPDDKQASLKRLAALSGKDFDTAFVRDVGVKDHQDDIELFESAGRATATPDIKAWIDQTLPALNMHLKQAKAL